MNEGDYLRQYTGQQKRASYLVEPNIKLFSTKPKLYSDF